MTNLINRNQPGTAVALNEERWRAAAQEFRAKEPETSTSFFSTRGGVFRVGDDELGTEICVVTVDAIWENTYYEGRYNPEEQNAPKCYAFGRTDEEMVPHETMQRHPEYFEPQAETCATCDWNKWGSAAQGSGKACQNRRRLAMLPAGLYGEDESGRTLDIYDTPEHYASADQVTLKLPVTSVKNWRKYVNKLADTVGRPPYGVITRVFLVPDANDQFHVNFEMVELLPDELFDTIQARHEQIAPTMAKAYSPPSEDGGPKRGKGTLRRR